MFVMLSAYFIKLVLYDSKSLINNSYNPRPFYYDDVKRGNIYDANKNILAESVLDENNKYIRKYNYGDTLSHFVGYYKNGIYGIEGKHNFDLQTISFEPVQRFKNIAFDDEIIANNVVTTVDIDLSKVVKKALGTQKGAVVTMEPDTGKITSMISYPAFNPQDLSSSWKEISNMEDSPLLNRATQGLYPPGSTFKILTTAAAIDNLPDYNTFIYDCLGEAVFGDNRIRCFDSKAHGEEDIKEAFAVSCNTYFSELGLKLTSDQFNKTVDSFYLTKPYNLDLDYSVGSFSLNSDSTVSETIETAIGQGKTLVTPLNMAMVASTIANNGVLMKPYVVDRIENNNDKIIEKFLPSSLGQAVNFETATLLKEYMIEVVESGTGQPVKDKDFAVAAKTGTAENSSGEDHSWFVGFAPADNPKIAFAILLENSGGGGKSMKVANEILNYYFSK